MYICIQRKRERGDLVRVGPRALPAALVVEPLSKVRPRIPRESQPPWSATKSISQKVFIKLFRKVQFPHQSVNLSFTFTNIKNKLTDLCGDPLLQNDCMNTFGEIKITIFRSLIWTGARRYLASCGTNPGSWER